MGQQNKVILISQFGIILKFLTWYVESEVFDGKKKQKRMKKSDQVPIEVSVASADTATTSIKSTNAALMMEPKSGPPSPYSSSHPHLPPHLSSESPSIQHRVRSRPTSRDVSPYPRSRPSTPNSSSTPIPSSSRPVAPRRSQRTLGKGPERPSGPPELEAALSIAIRNLESDVYAWWCANQKPGSPIPTTAYLKGRSPRIRKAAEAVDEADRLLNEAIFGKAKKGRTFKKARISPHPSPGHSGEITPETEFEQLELSSQGSALRPARVTPDKSN